MKYVIYLLNTALFIFILFIANIIRYKLKFGLNKQYKKVKEAANVNYTKIQKPNKKIKFLSEEHRKKIRDRLDKLGNPFNLTAEKYIALKIIIPIFMFIYLMICNSSSATPVRIAQAALAAFVGFFIIDFVYYLGNKDDMNKIRLDLEDVTNLINLQTVSGAPLANALTKAYEVCKLKRFKKSLIRLSARINLTKNLEKSLNEFNAEYDMPEIDTFVSLLKESIDSGVSEENMDDFSSTLNALNTIYQDKKTNRIDDKMVLVGFVLLLGIAALILFAVYSLLSGTAGQILK